MNYDNLETMSKSETLKALSEYSLLFNIPKLYAFNVRDYLDKPDRVIASSIKSINAKKLVIRSSASDEDSALASSAGEYDTVLNISSSDINEIKKAINTVIKSYKKKRAISINDQIIVQEMVQNSSMSGVVFTYDLNTGAPYYVINYDDQSGSTESVTSGSNEYSNRTLYIHRNSIMKLTSRRFIALIEAVKELEEKVGSQYLDIEFALESDLTPHLFQVRPITTKSKWIKSIEEEVNQVLNEVHIEVSERFKRYDGVYGETTVLGQMPDWNPVEMIGRVPRALAASLYKKLITNDAWQVARELMGYSIPKEKKLMIMLAGQPFIDTRLSFHSFIPGTIPQEIAEKLTNHWVERLKTFPELHDKVEFEVAITCFSFDIDSKIENLIGNVLTAKEKKKFRKAHLLQTKELISGKGTGSLESAIEKINILKEKQNHDINKIQDFRSLSQMIDECIDFGTTHFSILARHGFIAKTILLSLQKKNILTKNEIRKIQSNISTIATELVEDMRLLQLKKISNQYFMDKYGHLRPGTYDIMTLRYDQMNGFSPGGNIQKINIDDTTFKLSPKQEEKIDKLLLDEGFEDLKSNDLLKYIFESTAGREYGKFIFTRSVSNMLELVASFAANNNLTREEISHVPINYLINMIDVKNPSKKIKEISTLEAKKYSRNVAIRLPQLLINTAGVYVVPFQVSHPNFITNKKISAPSIMVSSNLESLSLAGKIILIEGADPGFDWIFSQQIFGLITKYGGANSHMAIRCAEFDIPAAIGCGEQRFEQVKQASQVHLDCSSGLIIPLP